MKIRYYMLMHRRFYKYLIENISKRYETMMEIVKACCENQEMVIVKYDENDEDLFLIFFPSYDTCGQSTNWLNVSIKRRVRRRKSTL